MLQWFYDVAITHLQPFKMEPRCQDEYKTCYAMYEIYEPLVKRYSIPVVSQKEGLWRHYALPPPPEYWDCTRSCAHPKHKGHRMLADIQMHYFLRMLQVVGNTNSNASVIGESILSKGSQELATLSASPFVIPYAKEIDSKVCKVYTTNIDHKSSMHMLLDKSHRGGVSSGQGAAEAILVHNANPLCWTYGEDVPGKFGWLINATDEHSACLGSPIVFRMKFGSHKLAIAMALQTYDKHAGMVEVAVSKPLRDINEFDGVDSYHYHEKAFSFQGMIDNYYVNHVGDDLSGHSTRSRG